MTYDDWAVRYPDAAAALVRDVLSQTQRGQDDASESWIQTQIRLQASRQGAIAWRNNVGATPAKEHISCPHCQRKFVLTKQPVRYGLCNDSQKLNERVKSGDLVLIIPRRITPDMIGMTIGQFGMVECKHANWHWTGNQHEKAQAACLGIVQAKGGYATFANGQLDLNPLYGNARF